MKKSSLVVVLLLCVTLAAPLFAQTSLQANVPFEFYFGKQLLPAGQYWISFDQSSRMATINDGHAHRLMLPARLETLSAPLSGSKLVFMESNGAHYLSQFGVTGESILTELTVSHKLASQDAAAKTVEVTTDSKNKK